MTPLDFVRSITPCVPPNPEQTPINMKLSRRDSHITVSSNTKEDGNDKVLDYFSFGDESNPLGLISFGRYLIFMTILQIPEKDLDVSTVKIQHAYIYMICQIVMLGNMTCVSVGTESVRYISI